MGPLVFTGAGIVSPVGIGFPAFAAALARSSELGESAFVRSPSVLSAERIPDAFAAEVSSFDPTPFLGTKGLRNFDRLTLFLLVAAKQALEDAGLKQAGAHAEAMHGADRIGVVSATAYGSLDAINELVMVSELEDPRFVNPNRFPNTVINSAAGYVSIWEDLRAPNVTVVDGNCGALDAMLSAEMHLANDRAGAFLVGGGEVLSDPLYLGFRKLGVLAEGERVYQPGNARGQGMRLGEAAAYFCVEQQAVAIARGARGYGRVLGYGNAFEPPESEAVVVHASRLSIERAIRAALTDAALEPSDIEGVCGSINGMAAFDQAELEVIASLLGPSVPVLAPKTLYGETFGSGGALGVACALTWLRGGAVGPIVQGEPCASPRTLLVLAVGFYGNVSALVVAV
jgi:3-oxoacyl-(acyl-carrier-protein) synthase